MLAGFCVFETTTKSEKYVRKIISPTMIEFDNEVICIPDIETFTFDVNKSQVDLENKYKISHSNALKLGYLTDKYAENFLTDKSAKIKYTKNFNQDCKFADIYVNNQSYKDNLIKSGFTQETGFTQLKNAEKLKLVIFNHKSGKFHTLDCKYGQIAHDVVALPENQLPKDAKPCKFCHVEYNKKYHSKSKKSNAVELKTYPLAISNGEMKLFLTDMTTNLKPDTKCNSLVCKELVNLINSSNQSIDIALYGWGQIPTVYNALQNAKNRGVKIRVVYDISTKVYYPETKTLLALANEKTGDNPQIFMHNKFIIFDNKKLLTGSMNFAPTGLSGFNSNCVVEINSKEIAEIYKKEFEQMLSGKFHTSKAKLETKTIQLSNVKITPLFSPKDKIITNNIIPLINNAKHYVYVPAFIITHEGISNALVNAHKRNVTVKIITDATNTTNPKSKVKTLRQAGIPVKIENYAGKLHSKTIIIDDKYLIVGSMNFSHSGELKNDENCLIIENERFAKYYREFFEYLWTKIPNKYLKFYVKAESKDSIGSCSDGIDNDYDGKIDLQDEACL
jgi:phosphatidylserine/phosphatidylglycerophosphate/cardiolipin synthase-like enzyme